MQSEINVLYFYFYILIILVIFAYVWIFNILKETNNTILLGLENMGIDNYLIDNNTELDLLKFYDTPGKDPYVDVSFIYGEDPENNLTLSVVDSDDIKVSTGVEIIKNVNNYKTLRISFVNNGSTFYKIRYKLSNNNGIEIIRIELKV